MMRHWMAAALFAGMAGFATGAAAQACNVSATDGACPGTLAAHVAAPIGRVAPGVGYQPVTLGVKPADADQLIALGAAPLIPATGAPALAKPNGASALHAMLRGAPDSPLAWVFAAGFLGFIVVRRARMPPLS